MTILRLYVAGTPRPQPRPRFVNGRVVSTASRAAKVWRARLFSELAWTRDYRGANNRPLRIATPVGVRLTFYMPTPKTERWGSPHTCRPDADNLAKAPKDCMVKAGILKDDSLVCELMVRKWWAQSGGVEILVYDPAAGPPVDDDVGAVEIVDNVDGAA